MSAAPQDGAASSFAAHLRDRGPCPLCGGTELTTRMPFDDIPVLRCGTCSMSFSAKVLDEAALERYYTHDFGSERLLHGQTVYASASLAAMRRLLGDELRRGLRVLDIGTGYGILLARLRDEQGCDVVGVELSVGEAAYARDELGLDVRDLALADAGLEPGAYDVVLAQEVIEHIPDPLAFLQEAAAYVRPGGSLLIGTDNFDASIVRRLRGAFPKWIPHTHVSHFNHLTLPMALDRVDGLRFERGVSYSGWEYLARAAATPRGARRDAAGSWDLASTLQTEMERPFPYLRLRTAINRRWFQLAGRDDLRGAMMMARARRIA